MATPSKPKSPLWPENGAFLVVGPPDNPGVSPARYRALYPAMIGCTFPITGDAELAHALCPGYTPRRQGAHLLARRFGPEGFRFLFLPKHLHLLLYYLFITKQADRVQPLQVAAMQGQDGQMVVAQLTHRSVTPYFRAAVDEMHAAADHLGHFNAWALAFLCHPRRAVMSFAALGADDISELTIDIALKAVKAAFDYARATPDAKPAINVHIAQVTARLDSLYRVLRTIITAEVTNPARTYLSRFGEAPSGVWITGRPEGIQGRPTASSFSQSFSCDIFAAAFGEIHACTLFSIDDKHTVFLIPIEIDDFKQHAGVAGCFWIPPYPPLCQLYAGMNELWHPRSRIFVRLDAPLKSQEVGGISDYGLSCIRWTGAVEPLPFLWYSKILHDRDIIQLSIDVEHYIKDRAVVINKKQ